MSNVEFKINKFNTINLDKQLSPMALGVLAYIIDNKPLADKDNWDLNMYKVAQHFSETTPYQYIQASFKNLIDLGYLVKHISKNHQTWYTVSNVNKKYRSKTEAVPELKNKLYKKAKPRKISHTINADMDFESKFMTKAEEIKDEPKSKQLRSAIGLVYKLFHYYFDGTPEIKSFTKAESNYFRISSYLRKGFTLSQYDDAVHTAYLRFKQGKIDGNPLPYVNGVLRGMKSRSKKQKQQDKIKMLKAKAEVNNNNHNDSDFKKITW